MALESHVFGSEELAKRCSQLDPRDSRALAKIAERMVREIRRRGEAPRIDHQGVSEAISVVERAVERVKKFVSDRAEFVIESARLGRSASQSSPNPCSTDKLGASADGLVDLIADEFARQVERQLTGSKPSIYRGDHGRYLSSALKQSFLAPTIVDDLRAEVIKRWREQMRRDFVDWSRVQEGHLDMKLEAIRQEKRKRREKRSGDQSGSANDYLLASALLRHHGFLNHERDSPDECDNYHAITQADLAAAANLARKNKSPPSRFIKKWFGGARQYKAACKDRHRLIRTLAEINGWIDKQS